MEDRVYCSLNIGMSGIVRDEQSVKTLQTYFDIGDIIQVQVEGQTQRYVVLKVLGPQIPVYINPPVAQQQAYPPSQQSVVGSGASGMNQHAMPFAGLAASNERPFYQAQNISRGPYNGGSYETGSFISTQGGNG
jgi:hypothetical protein